MTEEALLSELKVVGGIAVLASMLVFAGFYPSIFGWKLFALGCTLLIVSALLFVGVGIEHASTKS